MFDRKSYCKHWLCVSTEEDSYNIDYDIHSNSLIITILFIANKISFITY